MDRLLILSMDQSICQSTLPPHLHSMMQLNLSSSLTMPELATLLERLFRNV